MRVALGQSPICHQERQNRCLNSEEKTLEQPIAKFMLAMLVECSWNIQSSLNIMIISVGSNPIVIQKLIATLRLEHIVYYKVTKTCKFLCALCIYSNCPTNIARVNSAILVQLLCLQKRQGRCQNSEEKNLSVMCNQCVTHIATLPLTTTSIATDGVHSNTNIGWVIFHFAYCWQLGQVATFVYIETLRFFKNILLY